MRPGWDSGGRAGGGRASGGRAGMRIPQERAGQRGEASYELRDAQHDAHDGDAQHDARHISVGPTLPPAVLTGDQPDAPFQSITGSMRAIGNSIAAFVI